MPNSHKYERIASEIAKQVSEIVSQEANDEILKSITITGCTVTKDLCYAKLYFTSLLEKDSKELEREVNEASKFIRGRLGDNIEIRNIPELQFKYDTTIEYGNKIESIIKKIHQN
jgi:ribosome-binding factor A